MRAQLNRAAATINIIDFFERERITLDSLFLGIVCKTLLLTGCEQDRPNSGIKAVEVVYNWV